MIEDVFGLPGDSEPATDNYAAGAGGTPLQVAALPYRLGDGGREVLLVTSRRSGRWILPKGWPYHGASLIKSAAREAYEEAGVQGLMGHNEIGRFVTTKLLDPGTLSCLVLVYPLEVRVELDDWPEQLERQRRWYSLADAAEAISAEQRHILEAFSGRG